MPHIDTKKKGVWKNPKSIYDLRFRIKDLKSLFINLKSTMKYIPVIGLEVHVELKTKSKMFCACSADYFGKEPNTHTCPVCLGLPGALPVPNKKAIEWCVLIGMALNCKILPKSKFDRKNYFYPDLPKGYQISQYDQPFCEKGSLELSSGKRIGITRVHMEEDTAKLTHAVVDGKKVSLVDFNRGGVPLVEIVTEPDFDSAEDVVDYLKKLQQIVRYLGVSNADMEKGDMRLEPNISLRKVGDTSSQSSSLPSETASLRADAKQSQAENYIPLTDGNSKHSGIASEKAPRNDVGYVSGRDFELPNYKVEVKNINSFRFVAKSIEYEIKRQSEILDRGETPKQETRGFNEAGNNTVSQRSKEEAQDYRYFPDPDIPPIVWDSEELEILKKVLPELPDTKVARYIKDYEISPQVANTLAADQTVAELFDGAAKLAIEESIPVKDIANYIANQKPDPLKVSPDEIVDAVKEKKSGKIEDEAQLSKIAEEVIKENEVSVKAYKSGKENAIQALIGGMMRKTQGKADAGKSMQVLKKLLS